MNKLTSQKVNVSGFEFEKSASMALTKALKSSFDTIVIDKQNKPWILRPMYFENIKNKVIIIEKGVLIKAQPGAFLNKFDALLAFKNCENIKIFGNGAILQMNKKEYTNGEWRHGLSILNTRNFYVEKLVICDSGGDGIFIDGFSEGSFSENITIREVVCSNNKRQGISIISAMNVSVYESIFENTIGTLPGSGVDLEPDHKKDRMMKINFYDCIFRNNDHAGISVALHKLETDSEPVSIMFKNCVLSNNHNEANRYVASEITIGAHNTRPVKGSLLFKDCLVEDSQWGLFYSRKVSEAFKVTFENCMARNICLDEGISVMYLEVPDYYKGNFNLGGFEFDNLVLDYKTNVNLLTVRGSRLQTLSKVSDVYGDITIMGKKEKPFQYFNYDPINDNNFDLKLNFMKRK